MYYDKEGQQEYLSGVRVFQRDGEKYSIPTMTRDRNNQASKLLGYMLISVRKVLRKFR